MEEFDLDEVMVEDVWLDCATAINSTNTGVECNVCGGVSLFKYHMSRSGFSFTCNKCRKIQSRRKSQKKYALKAYSRKVKGNARLKDDALKRVDVLIDTMLTKLTALESVIRSNNYMATATQMRKNDEYRQDLSVYKEARTAITKDMRRKQGKSLEDYLSAARDKLEREVMYGADTGRKGEGRDKEAAEELWS